MKTLVCVSLSEQKARVLQDSGPRRDFAALAAAVRGELLYSSDARPNSLLSRLAGPHVRQALRAAWRLRPHDACFADGEHVGIPLAVILGVTGRRSVRLVMLGHHIDRPWKQRALRVATRIFPRGTLVLHSVTQRERVTSILGRRWEVRVLPYQVDTEYWRPTEPTPKSAKPVVLAVGSENRDYQTLIEASRGLDAVVRVAAGSHWARRTARAGEAPENVEYLSRPLPFSELREEYASADVVVVPLNEVSNQSGVTVILEAMSMARPVVVTATAGQRECIRGGLLGQDGTLDPRATASRGPQLFGDEVEGGDTGWYVPVADATSLRAGLQRLLASSATRNSLGSSARRAAERHFGFERFVDALADLLGPPRASQGTPGA